MDAHVKKEECDAAKECPDPTVMKEVPRRSESESSTSAEKAPDKLDKEKDEANNGILDLKELEESLPKPNQVLSELTITGVAEHIKTGKCKNVIFLTGAGISTSAGIPDFRSPVSGLYHNLQKYKLPHPQAIFEISYFLKHPEPFFTLAKELYPGQFKPTPSHLFMRLLHDKGILLRNFTQNIDTLEHLAGIPSDKILEAHGTFRVGHCTRKKCRKEYSQEWMKAKIFADEVPVCTECKSLVKPDIVFFGEQLPDRFFQHIVPDFQKCDLLIIMGTSLVVQPFASLVDRVADNVPRLLINDEKVGQRDLLEKLMGSAGLDFDSDDNYRDVFWKGNCDDGCMELARLIGWKKDLEALIESTNEGAKSSDLTSRV